jgi:GH15 family glucan-1,4-alpha-glucosidase
VTPPRRRAVLLGGAVAAVTVATGGGAAVRYRRSHQDIPLLSTAVGITGPGARTAVPAGSETLLVPGSRVDRTAPDASRHVTDERDWLDRAAPWTRVAGPFQDLLRGALLDVHSLLLPGGAVIAGWTPSWRYVWPRDAAHVAAALARTGHVDDAVAVLGFLQAAQSADGWFEARYRPDGGGPPDDRPRQLDGVGWALWGMADVARSLAPADAARRLAELEPMLTRCTDLTLALTGDGGGLPPASSDFWEKRESVLTLGTAAPLLAGLESAAELYARLGRPAVARRAAAAAMRLRALIRREFGPRYPRYLGGDERDAAVTFLLPPFVREADPAVVAAAVAAEREMRRPAGGVAPGVAWRRDGVTWTPPTALFALAAAATGRQAHARAVLTWLRDHRTPAGALPEKVRHDGRPAGVAPLSWTAALVLLTASTLASP